MRTTNSGKVTPSIVEWESKTPRKGVGDSVPSFTCNIFLNMSKIFIELHIFKVLSPLIICQPKSRTRKRPFVRAYLYKTPRRIETWRCIIPMTSNTNSSSLVLFLATFRDAAWCDIGMDLPCYSRACWCCCC